MWLRTDGQLMFRVRLETVPDMTSGFPGFVHRAIFRGHRKLRLLNSLLSTCLLHGNVLDRLVLVPGQAASRVRFLSPYITSSKCHPQRNA